MGSCMYQNLRRTGLQGKAPPLQAAAAAGAANAAAPLLLRLAAVRGWSVVCEPRLAQHIHKLVLVVVRHGCSRAR